MADVKWIKIATDIFDDDKILLIESMPEKDSIIVIWFKLLALAGKQNNSGVFMIGGKIPYTEAMFATIFRRDESIVHLAFETFIGFGMLEKNNGVFSIPNWGKHQSLDQLESKNEYMKNYMKKYREKQKSLSSGGCKTNGKTNSKSNVSEADKNREEKIREDEIRGEEEGEIFTPAPPSLPQVTIFVAENGLSVNPNRFFSYYNEKDWKTPKGNPIDWEAKIREWDYEEKQKAKQAEAAKTSGNPFLDLAKEENLI